MITKYPCTPDVDVKYPCTPNDVKYPCTPDDVKYPYTPAVDMKCLRVEATPPQFQMKPTILV